MINTIHTLENYEDVIKGKVILIFTASWCPDCHYMKTYIDEIVDENKDYSFYYIDRDEMIDLCIDLDILGIPSFIAYNDSKEVGRYVNKLRKTKEEVQLFINSLE